MASAVMQAASNPFSDTRERRKPKDAPKKEIWSTLLNSVSSGKRLPEKQLLLLGGSPETQKEFLESLSTEPSSSRRQQSRKTPPVANQYGLGYTYQDVLDADHEETLARLSVYTLSSSDPAFTPLLRPLLTPKTLSNTLILILVDWSQPWTWVRQLRSWIRLLRSLIVSLDDDAKHAMDSNITHMQNRKRSNTLESKTSEVSESEGALPLGPGEWDEPLGVPLCVVAQHTDKMATLEREYGWKDEQFDIVGQYVRTILLKHGGSLIYTMPSAPGSLQPLVHQALGISSTLTAKGGEVTYEVSNRDRTLVPMNWDSWAKIRMMADNFDPELISKAWSLDIQNIASEEDESSAKSASESQNPSAVSLYESTIPNPFTSTSPASAKPTTNNGIEVLSKDVQQFLAEQSKILDDLTTSDRKDRLAQESKKSAANASLLEDGKGHVEEHIGPVQFNVGGISVDAEEMVRKIKDREALRTNSGAEDRVKSPSTPKSGAGGSAGDAEMENQRLKDFFAGLAKKGGGSAANSPRRGHDG